MRDCMKKFYKMQRKMVILSILLCLNYYCLKIMLTIWISESEKAKKHKEYLKQKLKNEERLANVTQIWTQEIIPNWNQM